LQICAKFNASFSSLSYVVESERDYEHPGRELLNQHNKNRNKNRHTDCVIPSFCVAQSCLDGDDDEEEEEDDHDEQQCADDGDGDSGKSRSRL
jgi:hypothetical protein